MSPLIDLCFQNRTSFNSFRLPSWPFICTPCILFRSWRFRIGTVCDVFFYALKVSNLRQVFSNLRQFALFSVVESSGCQIFGFPGGFVLVYWYGVSRYCSWLYIFSCCLLALLIVNALSWIKAHRLISLLMLFIQYVVVALPIFCHKLTLFWSFTWHIMFLHMYVANFE